jgi:hypothetical protein
VNIIPCKDGLLVEHNRSTLYRNKKHTIVFDLFQLTKN